ncbi:MAG: hypothetical protein A2096_11365 [Spirochaetes bacterium GWF1_41_5]|nr:MAG: hypothetical protein A2096_11365 [Spirochaetes bacterium GWF1_41_5]
MKMSMLLSGFFWGAILILIGISIMIKTFFNIDLPVMRILFACLFIWIGIKILAGGKFPQHAAVRDEQSIIFGEGKIDVQEIKSSYSVIFGKGDIDLSRVVLDKDTTIEINTVFGSSSVKLGNYPVIISANSAFAEVKMPDSRVANFGSTEYSGKNSEGAHRLKIRASAVFGQMEFRQ